MSHSPSSPSLLWIRCKWVISFILFKVIGYCILFCSTFILVYWHILAYTEVVIAVLSYVCNISSICLHSLSLYLYLIYLSPSLSLPHSFSLSPSLSPSLPLSLSLSPFTAVALPLTVILFTTIPGGVFIIALLLIGFSCICSYYRKKVRRSGHHSTLEEEKGTGSEAGDMWSKKKRK